MIVGILSFQGDVAEHAAVLSALSVQSTEVRTVDDLKKIDRLIIPGGESTVIARHLSISGLDKEIIKMAKAGMPVFGTCAGAILLARKATGKNAPSTLGLIDITVDRNAYGAQLDSFEALISVKGGPKSVAVSFIRAPIITWTGKGVEVLATHGKHPVLVRQGKILAAACHPEMRGSVEMHEIFLNL